MRLPGQLVRGQMIAFTVGRCCGLMRVSSLVVILRGAVVWALRHGFVLRVLDAGSRPAEPLRYRPIQPPSTVRIVPVT
jgi:hypothetical protein